MRRIPKTSKNIKYPKISLFMLYLSIILTVLCLIIGVIFNNSTIGTFSGTIIMAGIAFYGFTYDRELNNNKKEKERKNVRKFLAIEIRSTTSNLEKFLNETISQKELQTGDNIKLWYKFFNQIIEAFETDEIETLNDFFRKLKSIDDLFKSKTEPTLYPKELELIANTVLIGEDILKKLFDEYDKLELDKNNISITEFKEIISSKDSRILEQQILKLNKQGRIENLFKKIRTPPFYFMIHEDSIPIFMEVLSKNKNILNISYNYIFDILKDLIYNKSYENGFSLGEDDIIIKECILKDESLIISVRLMYELNGAEEINEIILEKIHRYNKSGELLNCEQLDYILYYWSLIENREIVIKFIKETLKDENKAIQLIKECKRIKFMEYIIDLEYVEKRVDSLIKKCADKNKEKIFVNFKYELEYYIER